MDALKDLKWPSALVIVGAFGLVGLLVHMGQSLGTISQFMIGLAAAYMAWRQSMQGKDLGDVKTQVNGNNEALRLQVAEMSREMLKLSKEHGQVVAQLSAQLPPGSPLPRQLTEDPLRGEDGRV